MSKLRFFQKQQRLARFLRGTLHPEVAARLATRGFGPAERTEGETLLAEAVRARAARAPALHAADVSVERCEALEKAWVPVAQATLQRGAPDVLVAALAGVQRSEGLDVLFMLRLFVERVRALRASAAAGDVHAAKLLERRGLGEAKLVEIEAALAEANAAKPAAVASGVDAEEAEARAWAFFVEWSRIARTLVKEPALLRAMGFRKPRSAAEEGEPAEPKGPPDAPVAPPAPQPVA